LHLPGPDPSSEEVFRRAAEGDPLSREIIEEVAFYLGIGLASLSEIFDPEAIFLGGGVIRSWDQLAERTLKTLQEFSRWKTPIRLTRLGDDVGLLGAAALVLSV
jgi:glucokinase